MDSTNHLVEFYRGNRYAETDKKCPNCNNKLFLDKIKNDLFCSHCNYSESVGEDNN